MSNATRTATPAEIATTVRRAEIPRDTYPSEIRVARRRMRRAGRDLARAAMAGELE